MKRACFLVCCCCCVLLLMVLVATAVSGFFVFQEALEAPAGYVKSDLPLNIDRGKELYSKLETGHEEGVLSLSFSKEDLRAIVAAKLSEGMQKRDRLDQVVVDDVHVTFGDPGELSGLTLPIGYPVSLADSVRLDFVVALNLQVNQEPFIIYPLAKALVGINNCRIYWIVVDFGVGGYSILAWMRRAAEAGAPVNWDTDPVIVPLPQGTCATEFRVTDDKMLQIVFGPEGG